MGEYQVAILYPMARAYFPSSRPVQYPKSPIRQLMDFNDSPTGKTIQALADRRTEAHKLRNQNARLTLGMSLRMVDKSKIAGKNLHSKNLHSIESDTSTTGSLSRENSEDSTLSQSDSESLPSVPLSQLGLPRRAIPSLNGPPLEVPRLSDPYCVKNR